MLLIIIVNKFRLFIKFASRVFKSITLNKIIDIFMVFVSIITGKVMFNTGFIPLDINLFIYALYKPISILEAFLLGLFSLHINLILNGINVNLKKYLYSLSLLLFFTFLKLKFNGAFNPLHLNQFLAVLSSHVSFFYLISSVVLFNIVKAIQSLVDTFHFKFNLFKTFFKLIKNMMFIKLPSENNIVEKVNLKKPKTWLAMNQSDSLDKKNNSTEKKIPLNEDNRSKKFSGNIKYNKKSWALPTITDNLSYNEVWNIAVERRKLFKALYMFYHDKVLDLAPDSDSDIDSDSNYINKKNPKPQKKINPNTAFYKKAFIQHQYEWQSIFKSIENKKLEESRIIEIKLTNRIDEAINNLPSIIVPKVKKVGTKFIVDESSINYSRILKKVKK